ncbi:ANTAR domain-containing protein [Cryobacterium sp. SO2]|uniref:ANTAR domain-containing protein n=1 Tax=Cryobacterium sp. SO2 TaxID=1897060 RepID=UPI00223CD88E|nr:ANTAR domain-containing protein [Cryobacterium sp. SO2]WEO76024.1 ANTAR domain-containing protein [Cryobacterium sp. SO2]
MAVKISEGIRTAASWHNPQVHQATGMIIAQTNVSADEALCRLVAQAAATESTVDQVAAEVLAGKRLPLP